MKNIDLHTHSTCSDGSLTPTELVAHAVKLGLHTIALTDHDTLDGLAEAQIEADKLGLGLIPGVEISTLFKTGKFMTRELHILGLGLNINSPTLKKTFEALRIYRQNRNTILLQRLNEAGVSITEQEMKNSATTANITKAHFAKIITDKGHARDVNHAFELFFRGDTPTNIPKQCLSPEEAIQVIHEGGGVAILAHPFRYGMDMPQIEELVNQLMACGINGIEAIYSTHHQDQEDFLINLAQKNQLLISGGTDFHGITKPDIEIGIGKGNLQIPLSIWTTLEESLSPSQNMGLSR